ncbi:hypothetical protein [Pollutimonas bauzanensis]|uniref:Uncharacterized protein n=1 Tax=Pollutimonas bauzanensis TaxID=658167 RepID=A0A1M5YKN0_9BURK|nr:hypothetical protein [Pollutimonas bauzanensis]SHI12469.1 hypothetical protein SAMN04488135_109181 [Pollutimonas bauzanensis]
MLHISSHVADLLDNLGLTLGSHQVELVNFKRAKQCSVRHDQVPVAITGYTLVSPAFARGRFPECSFIDMIEKRSSMDDRDACALAAICGVDVMPPFWGNPRPFGEHVWNIIDLYELGAFFERVNHRYGNEGDHYLMRPRGLDWSDPDQPELPGGLQKWRSDYRELPPVRQLMVATVLQLYLQGDDRYWMVRVPKKWHAAEGIEILHAQGVLADWAKLYALYPGW